MLNEKQIPEAAASPQYLEQLMQRLGADYNPIQYEHTEIGLLIRATRECLIEAAAEEDPILLEQGLELFSDYQKINPTPEEEVKIEEYVLAEHAFKAALACKEVDLAIALAVETIKPAYIAAQRLALDIGTTKAHLAICMLKREMTPDQWQDIKDLLDAVSRPQCLRILGPIHVQIAMLEQSLSNSNREITREVELPSSPKILIDV